ncbi:MAG: hypothetical protein ACI9BO_000675 [Zhongshania sp.]|jgi:hypothetical protein
MINTKTRYIERPGISRNLLLCGFLALAVALVPKQAYADNAQTAAAVLIGAAVLYAAHDAHKSDRHYARAHVHDRHCGHHNKHYKKSHRDPHYGHGYSNRGRQYYSGSHGDRHQGHYQDRYRDRYQGHHQDRYRDKHQGKGKHFVNNDKHDRYEKKGGHKGSKDRHNDRYWDTRVAVSQRY